MATNDITRLWTFSDGSQAPDAPPPVTDAQLDEFEIRYGIKLPPEMIKLYQQQNGGFSERHLFSFWSIQLGKNSDITTLSSLIDDHDEDGLESIWKKQLGDLNRVFIILGDGHFYFVLNYNEIRDGQPIVWYVSDEVVRSTSLNFADWLFSDGGAA
ncbi:SMI1/KNR4 family protein [Gimesia aquarii]|uniref:SMI1 / KNR4 family protein n=1 Tax=Gimesia aquarii TaxID=2527964 RepID=A0A517W2V9_9PLAN|nr:SMI1/KNR4 family protein [Gimesia aquarii]QDT99595.1 SMI1 / KNR4 family protein [Gimesia aquarii]